MKAAGAKGVFGVGVGAVVVAMVVAMAMAMSPIRQGHPVWLASTGAFPFA